MKFLHSTKIAITILLISIIIFSISLFEFQLSRVNKSKALKEIVIERGSIEKIAETLYKEKLIRNKFAFRVYTRITGKTNLKAATYQLSPNMGSKKIIDIMHKGKGVHNNEISITLKEGYNIPKLINILTEKTTITEEEITKTLKDKEYLQELINEYWFLTDDILNDKIYYSLEGYLYPNTYFIKSKDVDIKEILTTFLDETKKQLSPYQDKLKENSFGIHKLITLASIIELEGITLEDRKGIAGVFINRLEKRISLGSDVTTYYGAKVAIGERDLYAKEVNTCNDYNTRCTTFEGLPVSPIDNPSIEAIEAALEPDKNDYFYFVADKNKKVYFSKNITEHNNQIAKLKKQGLWFEY